MNVTLLNGEATLSLTAHQETRMIEAAAVAYATAAAEQEALSKVYTLPQLAYRMKMSRTSLLRYLNLAQCNGGIRHRRAGTKYLVSELAVREWFGDQHN